jgi:glycosyltransferase involved in cell wall biosynthesis
MAYTMHPGVTAGLTWRLAGASSCIWNQRASTYQKVNNFLECFAVRQVPNFVSNSLIGCQFLQKEFSIPKNQITVIRNGIQLQKPLKTPAEWRQKLNVSPKVPLVTMLAHFRKAKDHHTLLKAWRVVINEFSPETAPILILAGDDMGELTGIMRQVDELGVTSHVRTPGYVEDVYGLLASSAIYVHISIHEGTPNGVLEAMASGLPVVGTDIPGIRECLPNANGDFLVPHLDKDYLTATLLRLLKDEGIRAKIGTLNQKHVEKYYSMRGMLETYIQYIRKIVPAI